MAPRQPMDLTLLSKREEEAVKRFLNRLFECLGNQIHQVILYGSKARGDSEIDSDVDLLVLLKPGSTFRRGDVLRLAARVSLDYDVLLSVVTMTRDQWDAHRGLTMYANIQRDGLPIAELL